jgi:hypothetical protein
LSMDREEPTSPLSASGDEEEGDDDLLFNPQTGAYASASGGGGGGGGTAASSSKVEVIVSRSTLSGKVDSDKYNNRDENVKNLFELPLHEFEDLLAELKYIHSFYSKLANGLNELKHHPYEGNSITTTTTSSKTKSTKSAAVSGGGSSSSSSKAKAIDDDGRAHMIRNLFNSHDVHKSGKINMCDLEETILMFDRYPWFDHDEQKDPKLFIKYICQHDHLSAEADNIDFDKFASTLTKFLRYQFNNSLRPYVTDKYVFVKYGGVIHEKSDVSSSSSTYEIEQLKMKYEKEIADLKTEHAEMMNKANHLKHSMEEVHAKKVALKH